MHSLKSVPILWKIIIGAGILILVTVLVVVQSLGALGDVSRRSEIAFSQHAQRVVLANTAYILFDNLTTSDRDQVFARSESDRAAAETSYNSDIASGYKTLDQLAKLTADASDRAAIDKARTLLRTYETLERQAFGLARDGKRDEAYAIITGDAGKAYNDGTAVLDAQIKAAQDAMVEQKNAIGEQAAGATRTSIIAAVVGCSFGAAALIWIVLGQVSGPLKGLQ